jgi:hypothetical protein
MKKLMTLFYIFFCVNVMAQTTPVTIPRSTELRPADRRIPRGSVTLPLPDLTVTITKIESVVYDPSAQHHNITVIYTVTNNSSVPIDNPEIKVGGQVMLRPYIDPYRNLPTENNATVPRLAARQTLQQKFVFKKSGLANGDYSFWLKIDSSGPGVLVGGGVLRESNEGNNFSAETAMTVTR